MTARPLFIIGLFAALVALGYDSYRDAYNAGLKLYRQRDWPGAAQAFTQAVELAETPNDRCNAQLLVGHACRRAGDYRLAREAYAKVITIDGASPAYVYHACQASAQVALTQRDYAAAERIYLDLTAVNDLSAVKRSCLYNHLAQVYAVQQQLDKAEQAYKQSLAIDGLPPTTRADSLLAYGNFLYTCNRYADARDQYRKVLALEDIAPEKRCLAQHRVGLTWFADKDYQKASKAFDSVVHHDAVPERLAAEAALYLGLSHLQLNQIAQARAELERLPTMKGAAKWHLDTARTQLERLERLDHAVSATNEPAP